MRKIILTTLIFLIGTLLNAQVIAEQNEEFDPMTLNEPPISFMNITDIYEIISDIHDYSHGNGDQPGSRIIDKQGWKIQIISTKNFYEADSIQQRAKSLFPNEEVVSVFNSPYYKIRLGNCESRDEAERLLQSVKRKNLGSPWVIPSRIKVREKIYINK